MNTIGGPVQATDIVRFSETLDGRVIDRSSVDYEARREALAWNGRLPARRPDMIVTAKSLQDVRAAIDFARQHHLQISLRGNGHSYSVDFLRDGGMLIDLSALNDISIDRREKRLSVGPGATSAQIDTALADQGLAFPVGHAASVGIAGFLLGGGLGINCAAWGGMSTFNILAADLMLANGHIVQASPDENSELYWALRGGGPGLPFIVTRFHLRCHDRPAHITANTYLARFADLPELAEHIDATAPTLDPRLQVMLAITPVPPQVADRCSADDHGRVVALTAIAFADTAAEARSLHAPLAATMGLRPLLDRSADGALTFADIFGSSDQLLVCSRVRADNVLTDRLSDAVRILMRHLPDSPSPASVPMIVLRNDAAFPEGACPPPGRYFVSTYAQWDLAKDDPANTIWLRHFYDDLAAIATGAYVNEFDLEGRLDEVGRCYSAAALNRLRTLRGQHDPHRVFRDPFSRLHP